MNALHAANLWHERTDSLHLAYHDDEADVIREFITAAPVNGFECQWLDPPQVLSKSSAVKLDGHGRLRGGM
jgi:hypothetical protein